MPDILALSRSREVTAGQPQVTASGPGSKHRRRVCCSRDGVGSSEPLPLCAVWGRCRLLGGLRTAPDTGGRTSCHHRRPTVPRRGTILGETVTAAASPRDRAGAASGGRWRIVKIARSVALRTHRATAWAKRSGPWWVMANFAVTGDICPHRWIPAWLHLVDAARTQEGRNLNHKICVADSRKHGHNEGIYRNLQK